MNNIEPMAVVAAQGEIDLYRAEIETIDKQILALLNQRFVRAKNIGLVKKRINADVLQPSREGQLLRNLCQDNEGPLNSVHIRAIWREIFRASRYIQSEPMIAYLGPEGTYTEDAMRAHFGIAHTCAPCDSVDAVFDAVVDGRAVAGVVPVENSTEGIVARTLDLILARNVQVEGEVILPVSHCLMSSTGTIASIECVIGHEQALGQCHRWLEANLPGVPRRAVSSNAYAARLATESDKSAAIGSRRAARHYGLQVVADSIHDERLNNTRFYVISRTVPVRDGADRTLLCVELDNRVGSLQQLLASVAEQHIPVTRLDSRPLRSELWAYRFFLELARHRNDAGLTCALANMMRIANSVVVLGSYRAARNDQDTESDTSLATTFLEQDHDHQQEHSTG